MSTMSIPNIFLIYSLHSISGNIILKSSDRTIIYNTDDQNYTPTPIPLTLPESQLSQETHLPDHLTTPLTTNISFTTFVPENHHQIPFLNSTLVTQAEIKKRIFGNLYIGQEGFAMGLHRGMKLFDY